MGVSKVSLPIETQPTTHSQFFVIPRNSGVSHLATKIWVWHPDCGKCRLDKKGTSDVKTHVSWPVCGLCLVLASLCSAADFISIRLDCKGLQASEVGQQRIQVPDSGFSVLPPQGENWCVRSMASEGVTFLKPPTSVEISAQPPTPNDLFQVVLQTVRFMGIAVALPEFGTHPSPDQLKVVVDELISNHFFSQVVGGISSAERHFQLMDSHSAIDRSFGANCVRFDAKVEEVGAYLAPADVVINLNFLGNLICAHPQPMSAKSSLVWIGFIEVYREGDQSTAATLSAEVEPFLRSLEFTGPKIVSYQTNHQIF